MQNYYNDTKGKILGVLYILLIYMFSICIYKKTLSILAFAGVYTFFVIRSIIAVYSRYFGHLDKKGLIIIKIITIILLCFGYYFAYACYYYEMFSYEGYSFLYVLINFIPLINKVDNTVAVGSLFFILFTYLVGFQMNKQYIHYELMGELDKRLSDFKIEFGIENAQEKNDNLKNALAAMIIVGFISLGLGIVNDKRFEKNELLITYQSNLAQLKTVNKDAYDRAKEVFFGNRINYDFCSSNYYIKGDSELLYITADFDAEEYSLYYDQELYGTILEMEWGDWIERNGKYTLTTLDVKAKGNGYAVIKITNDVNGDSINIFVDNLDYYN